MTFESKDLQYEVGEGCHSALHRRGGENRGHR